MKQISRPLAARFIGTTVVWFDFVVFAQAAAWLLGDRFFQPLGNLAQITALASIGAAFLLRPVGLPLLEWLEARFGGRVTGIATLMLVGVLAATVGLLPTTATAGTGALVLLVVARLLLGIAAAAEWTRSAVLAVRTSPDRTRGISGAAPQLGLPLGMALAALVIVGCQISFGASGYAEWGWRVPFLITLVLALLGAALRALLPAERVASAVAAPPAAGAPWKKRAVLATLGMAAGSALTTLVLSGFLVEVDSSGARGSQHLGWLVGAAFICAASLVAAARWSDLIGCVQVYKVGYFLMAVLVIPLFWLLSGETAIGAGLALLLAAIPVGLVYGPLPAMLAEVFPARLRLRGTATSYAIGTMIGGAFAPLIAHLLVRMSGDVMTVASYLVLLTVLCLAAVGQLPSRQHESATI